MPCKATLADLVESLAENMSVVELAQTAIRVEISKTIREARKQLNLSQKELAEKMGVKQSMVSRWESGECNYTIDTLVQIANALNLSVECPLVFEEVSVPVNSVSVRPQSAHTIVSENTEFSNVIRLDFGKVTNGGAAEKGSVRRAGPKPHQYRIFHGAGGRQRRAPPASGRAAEQRAG